MPYYITDKSPDCSGWAAVTAEGRVIGCHKTKQGAIDQMVAVSLAENIKPGGTYQPRSTRAVDSGSYNPPVGVQNAAKRALKWISDGKAGNGFTSVGRSRASQLASGGPISAQTVNKMIAYFARHAVDKNAEGFSAGEKNFPSPGRVAWDAWGGDPGQTWVNGLSKRSMAKNQLSETRIDTEKSTNEVVMKSAVGVDHWRSVAKSIVSKLNPIHEAPISEERGRKMETRINHTEVEFREVQDGKGMTFEGYAAVFNSPSEPIGGQFTEYVKPGAFKRSLEARNDVKLLWNHDTGEVLGSTRAGTLRLVEDSHGLKAVAELPNTQRGRDTAELLRRGDVANMSFGFSVPKGGDSWRDNGGVRELNSVRLHEVSIVAYPAYLASSASVRATVNADALAEALMALENGEDLTPEQAQMITDVVNQLVKADGADVSTDPVDPLAMIPLSDGMDAPDGMPGDGSMTSDTMCDCGCDCCADCECDCECECDSPEGTKISVEVEIELNSASLDVKKKNLDLLMKRL